MIKGGAGSGQKGHTGIVPRDLRSQATKDRDKLRRKMKVY